MKNIIFIAPPAAGKGTQSDLLVKKYGYIHISTGDLLRSEIASGSELGNNISELMKSGSLVSTEIVTEILRKRLSQDDIKKGFIIDGYPRKVEQCQILTNLLSDLNLKIDAVIYLDMDVDKAMRRAVGRLTCPKCKRGYNKFEDIAKPQVDNICDDCGVMLENRSDDNEESFKIRFNQFLESAEPILNYYRNLGILNVVDNSGTPEEIFKKIEEVI